MYAMRARNWGRAPRARRRSGSRTYVCLGGMHVTNLVATILAALANGYADSLNFVGAESVKLVADRAGSGPERADDASWRGVRSGVVLRYLLAVIAMLTTPVSFQSSVAPVPKPVRADLR